MEVLGGDLPPPCRAAGGLPPGRGAVGPLFPQNYISESFDVVLNIFDTIRNH